MLEIRGARVSDTARYACVARNLAGETERITDIVVQGMLFKNPVTYNYWVYIYDKALKSNLRFDFKKRPI